jgi:hypothetical protein
MKLPEFSQRARQRVEQLRMSRSLPRNMLPPRWKRTTNDSGQRVRGIANFTRCPFLLLKQEFVNFGRCKSGVIR